MKWSGAVHEDSADHVGATAVRVVRVSRRGSREIEHLESAYGEAELEAAAQRGRAAGARPGLEPAAGGPLPITSSRMGHLLDALEYAYRVLGLAAAADGDDVFRHLVPARVIELVSKLDSLRVLEEAGVARGMRQSSAACRRTYRSKGGSGCRPTFPSHCRASLITAGYEYPLAGSPGGLSTAAYRFGCRTRAVTGRPVPEC